MAGNRGSGSKNGQRGATGSPPNEAKERLDEIERLSDFARSARFSGQEHGVFRLTWQGANGKQIANQMKVKPSTVDVYWKRLMKKAGTDTRIQTVVAFARFVMRRDRRAPPTPQDGAES